MRIAVLARKKGLYSNRRLREEAKELGYLLSVVDPAELEMVLGRRSPTLIRAGKAVNGIDLVIPRSGASITQYGLAVVSQFEMMGVPLLNGSAAIGGTRNKLRCLQTLSRHDIDIPRTVVIRHPAEIASSVERVGGFPVILKLLSGTQGIGVIIADRMQTIEGTIDTLWALGHDILIQECVKESLGRDIRVIVVGGRVVAAMRRQARIGEFRSNIHRGGIGTPVTLDRAFERTAMRAAKIVGLDVAGVDLLESHSGPKVIELNSSPGLEGIETVTGINVAREILKFGATRIQNGQSRKKAG